MIRAAAWLAACAGAVACTATAPRAPSGEPAAPPPGVRVQAVKQELQVTPWELVFSGIRGRTGDAQFVNVRNSGSGPHEISRLAITGDHASTFKLGAKPQPPIGLAPAAYTNLSVGFAPPSDEEVGLHRGTLRIFVGPEDDIGIAIDLVGLVTAGTHDEPALELIVEALGFGVDVGPRRMMLGTDVSPIGAEKSAQRFTRVRATPVAVYPAARYSAGGSARFGWYSTAAGGAAKLHELGTIAEDQTATLNPGFEGEAKSSFDPGADGFGLYVTTPRGTVFTDDRRNSGKLKHAARVFPLRTRAGQSVPDAFLIAMDEGGTSDYQDFVFLMYNARTAP